MAWQCAGTGLRAGGTCIGVFGGEGRGGVDKGMGRGGEGTHNNAKEHCLHDRTAG